MTATPKPWNAPEVQVLRTAASAESGKAMSIIEVTGSVNSAPSGAR